MDAASAVPWPARHPTDALMQLSSQARVGLARLSRWSNRRCGIGLARRSRMLHNSASGAGWSSLAARRAHNPKVAGSNPAPATNKASDEKAIPETGSLFSFHPVWQRALPESRPGVWLAPRRCKGYDQRAGGISDGGSLFQGNACPATGLEQGLGFAGDRVSASCGRNPVTGFPTGQGALRALCRFRNGISRRIRFFHFPAGLRSAP